MASRCPKCDKTVYFDILCTSLCSVLLTVLFVLLTVLGQRFRTESRRGGGGRPLEKQP